MCLRYRVYMYVCMNVCIINLKVEHSGRRLTEGGGRAHEGRVDRGGRVAVDDTRRLHSVATDLPVAKHKQKTNEPRGNTIRGTPTINPHVSACKKKQTPSSSRTYAATNTSRSAQSADSRSITWPFARTTEEQQNSLPPVPGIVPHPAPPHCPQASRQHTSRSW